MKLTTAQRKALKRIYDRGPNWFGQDNYPPSYTAFRRTVTPYWDGSDCVSVKAGHMWLGIETDGYTHS